MPVTFQGNPITLAGHEVKVGERVPDFLAVNNSLETVSAETFKGKRIYVSVPSIDTDVCDLEVRRFNEEAVNLKGAKVYVISMDLPFAQARWCGAKGVDKVMTLSDYKDHSFAHNFGTYIEELGLLTRAVFVINEEDEVVYVEYCSEVTNEPDYKAALDALNK
ncbi:thiol peroxidase [Niameybacter massiliensis]|uniref:Thiol peroxidase n=1 Tax=Holtiella tumoricola TaxID=3018743 RepID=A0AA42DPA0_9FIRM|nr:MULTISPECIES: thiol peroxidase [Lachnospirales]MDA3733072.1 thiol peroxidase [Holtiella tumoricola]